MSNLLGWFGRKKKRKRPASAASEHENIRVYQVTKLPQSPLVAQNVVDNTSCTSDIFQPIRPKSQLISKNKSPVNDLTYNPDKKVIYSNRQSLTEPLEQNERRKSSAKVSVLIPVSQTEYILEQPRVSRQLHVQEFQPQKFSLLQKGPETRVPLVNPNDVTPARPSTIQYEERPNNQERVSVVRPTKVNESQRLSMNYKSDESERFVLNSAPEPVVYAVRRSTLQPNARKSVSLRKSVARKRDVEVYEDQKIEKRMPIQQVYAANTEPTRGRTSYVLQQSVKSLASKQDEIQVPRKNIRYSVDTDVFSADVKRKGGNQVSPGFVTMERGQGMLVSELLNPITSIFVSDLKNPVPKDPGTRPREYNNWVRPRQNSMRQVVTPKPQQYARHVNVATAAIPGHRNHRSNKRYNADDESSDESEDSYHPQSKYNRKPIQHRVYNAEMPSMTLPKVSVDLAADEESTRGEVSSSKQSLIDDYGKEIEITQPHYVRRLSLAEKTDVANTLNFLCNPQAGQLGPGSEVKLTVFSGNESSKAKNPNENTNEDRQ